MQELGLEYLRFADGLERFERDKEQTDRFAELLVTIVKSGLVASDKGYDEEQVFAKYFSGEPVDAPESADDAETDLDYSAVEFGTPEASELEMLARMLGDDTVTVDGGPIEGPDAVQVSPPEGEELPSAIPPPREVDLSGFDQPEAEWI